MTPPAVLMTAEELLALSIPDKRTELVRGVLVVREPAGYAQGGVAMNLGVRLSATVSTPARASSGRSIPRGASPTSIAWTAVRRS